MLSEDIEATLNWDDNISMKTYLYYETSEIVFKTSKFDLRVLGAQIITFQCVKNNTQKCVCRRNYDNTKFKFVIFSSFYT